MDAEDLIHEHQPESVPRSRFVNPFYGPSGIPVATSSISSDNNRPDLPAGSTSIPTGIQHPHAHSRLLSHPFFFPSGTFVPPPHPVTHRMDPQMTSRHLDQSVLSETHAFPAHFPPWSPHTHHSSFPGQYVMPSHTTPFQNQPSQPHGHHLLEFNQFPPTRHLSFPLQRSVPLQHEFNVETSSQSYRHLLRPPLRVRPSSISNPHEPYGTQQYLPSPYNLAGHFTSPRQHQPYVFPWYYGPTSFPLDMFDRSIPPQTERHYHPHTSTRYVRRDFNMPREQSTAAESFRPVPRPSGHPIIVTTPYSSASPAAASTKANPISVKGSPKPEQDGKQASRTYHNHHRPSVRRHYHPNSPPNRSEWVMWVGNVPSDTTHDELWQFLNQLLVESSVDENRGADKDSGVLSIFLISRSNCAFVNYQSEQHMDRAIFRFNGRPLRVHDPRCPQLVCRARRKEDDLRAGVGAQRGTGVHRHFVKHEKATPGKSRALGQFTRRESSEEKETPISSPEASTKTSSTYPSTTSSLLTLHFPKRFFILKSLTRHALDLGVQHGAWATQKHNEVILDQAFRTSKEVILIFSVNKSGEFYGYARMAGGILRDSPSINWALRADPSPNASSYSSRSVFVHATPVLHKDPHHSPQKSSPSSKRPLTKVSSSEDPPVPSFPRMKAKAHQERRSAPPALQREDLIHVSLPLRSSVSCGGGGCSPTPPDLPSSALQSGSDKNNGLLAKARSKGDDADPPGGLGSHLQPVVEEAHGGLNILEEDDPPISLPSTATDDSEVPQPETSWGDTFKVEWLSTARISFQRTRHIRNPWNHGREIKISRDGTEVEPRVGQQLIEEWSRLANESTDGYARQAASLAGSTKGNRSRPGRILKR